MSVDLRQEWEIPQGFWEVIDAEFGFWLDACASKTNRKCKTYWDIADDGLARKWLYHTWCNPGFKNVYPWLKKAREEVCRLGRKGQIGRGAQMVVMGRVNPSTKAWNEQGLRASEIRLLRPRVQFIAPPGVKQSTNMQENALFIYRYNPHRRPADIWTWNWR